MDNPENFLELRIPIVHRCQENKFGLAMNELLIDASKNAVLNDLLICEKCGFKIERKEAMRIALKNLQVVKRS